MPRALHLFVSSTFRDLQAERDALARQCFPQARQSFAQAGVAFQEIDLRWGLDSAEGEARIVDLCLQEVRRCEGHFVAVLGARYGFVPRAWPSALATGQPTGDMPSITEMEVMLGVWHTPSPRFVRFYLKQEDPRAPDEPRMAALKARVRDGGWPVRVFARPEELATQMLGDLSELAARHAAAATAQPDAAPSWEQPLAVMARGVVPRIEVQSALESWAAAEPAQRLALVGPAGAGKSAQWACWLQARRNAADTAGHSSAPGAAQPTPPAWRRWMQAAKVALAGTTGSSTLAGPELWLVHLAGNRAGEGRLRGLLADQWAQLARALRRPADEPAPADLRALQQAVHQRVAEACTMHRRVWLVVDGAEQIGLHAAFPWHWLPPPHPRLAVLLISRPIDALGRLPAPAGHAWWRMLVSALTPADRAHALVAYLADFGKVLPPPLLEGCASSPALRTPADVRLLADELRLAGAPEVLQQRALQLAAAAEPRQLAEAVLQRLRAEHGIDLVDAVCKALAVSRGGLYESELRSVVDASGQIAGWRWSSLMQAFRRSVFDVEGRLGLYHEALAQAVHAAADDGTSGLRTARLQLIQAMTGPLDASRWSALARQPRAVQELPWQALALADEQNARRDRSTLLVALLSSLVHSAEFMAAVVRVEPERALDVMRAALALPGVSAAALHTHWAETGDAEALHALALLLAEARAYAGAVGLATASASRAGADRPTALAAAVSLSALLLQEGRAVDARAVLARWASAAPRPDVSPLLQASLYNALGACALAAADAATSRGYFEQSEQLHAGLGHVHGQALAWHNMALADLTPTTQIAEPGGAERASRAARLLARAAGVLEPLADAAALCDTLLAQARAAEQQTSREQVAHFLQRALACAEAAADVPRQAAALDAQARWLELQGQRDRADERQATREQRCAAVEDADGVLAARLARVAIRMNLGPRAWPLARQMLLQARVAALAAAGTAADAHPRIRPATQARLEELTRCLCEPSVLRHGDGKPASEA
jgi:hypothetical protein